MNKLFYFFLFIIVLPVISQAQAIIKWDKYRPLEWSDFKGKPILNVPFKAFTHVDISYSYSTELVDGEYKLKFVIENNFVKNASWVNSENRTEALLKHEQLHFDINEFYARALYHELMSKVYTRNYQDEVRAIFASVIKRLKVEQLRYDAETVHSTNKEKQADWEAVVKQQLLETPPYQ